MFEYPILLKVIAVVVTERVSTDKLYYSEEKVCRVENLKTIGNRNALSACGANVNDL